MNEPEVRRRARPVTLVWLVAGLTLRDLRRNVGAWRLPLLTSGMLALLFLGSATITDRVQDRAELATFRIAASGDLTTNAGLLDEIDGGDITLEPGPSAANAVRDRDAAAGLRLPSDVTASLDAGEPVELTIARRSSQHNSVNGASRLAIRLTLLLGAPNRSLITEEVDVADDVEASRDQFARTAAGFSAFLVLGVVTSTAGILGRTRERRGSEPLLVLPLPRSTISVGVALGALPMAVAFVSVGLAVMLSAALLPLPTLHQPADVLIAALPAGAVAAVVLATLGTALGVMAGSTGGGSEDSVGLGDLLTMPVLALGLALLAAPDLTTNATTLSVPGLGPMLVLRDALLGQGSLPETLVACATTVAASGGLMAVAAIALEGERNVRRI